MSEDRNKHDRAGTAESPLGHKVGRSAAARVAEGRAGMSQHIPDKVRAKVEGKGKTQTKGKEGRK